MAYRLCDTAGGTLGVPGVGTFKNGRADLYDYEPIGGRTVKVRFSIWKITEDAMQTEQAFSDDGGKTWDGTGSINTGG